MYTDDDVLLLLKISPYEWLSKGEEGRSLLCLVYLMNVPERITPEVQQAINTRCKTSTELFRTAVKRILKNPEWFDYRD